MPEQPKPYKTIVLSGTALDLRYRALVETVADQLEYDEMLDPLTPEMKELIHITRMLKRLELGPNQTNAIKLPEFNGYQFFLVTVGGCTFIYSVQGDIIFLAGAYFFGHSPDGGKNINSSDISITGMANKILMDLPNKIQKNNSSNENNMYLTLNVMCIYLYYYFVKNAVPGEDFHISANSTKSYDYIICDHAYSYSADRGMTVDRFFKKLTPPAAQVLNGGGRIAVFGAVGSGKSMFVNAVINTAKYEVTDMASIFDRIWAADHEPNAARIGSYHGDGYASYVTNKIGCGDPINVAHNFEFKDIAVPVEPGRIGGLTYFVSILDSLSCAGIASRGGTSAATSATSLPDHALFLFNDGKEDVFVVPPSLASAGADLALSDWDCAYLTEDRVGQIIANGCYMKIKSNGDGFDARRYNFGLRKICAAAAELVHWGVLGAEIDIKIFNNGDFYHTSAPAPTASGARKPQSHRVNMQVAAPLDFILRMGAEMQPRLN